jgi:hypothetical protein
MEWNKTAVPENYFINNQFVPFSKLFIA